MDGFHRSVEAHRPAPEKCGAFGRSPAIGDLFDLAFAAVATDRKDRCPVHRKQECRSIEKHNRESVERVVEKIAVTDRESGGPIEMREDAVRDGFGPAAHQQRTDETEHKHQPDRTCKGPGDMRAHVKRARPAISARPPQSHRQSEKRTGEDEPAPFRQRHKRAEAPFRPRWLEREPEQLTHELDRIPIDRSQHVETDDFKRDQPEDERQRAQRPEIDRPELGIAQLAHPVAEAGLASASGVSGG